MLYPKKNLIPDFYDSQWFSDTTVPVPTVQIINPYKIIMTNTMSAQGRLIWIPVEIGKTYTFSFKYISGLYRIYRRKVNNHDNTMVLVQDSVAGKPDTYTFTVDASYQGFITLRLTYGGAGVLVFENLQLEEGSVATDFSPYELGMKKRKRLEKINEDMSSGGTHGHPYGNVISVKEDVRLWNATIKINTVGSFNIRIFEWDNGRVGQDLFSKDATYGIGTFTYSFGGIRLRAGKKYWIGRVSTDPTSTDNDGNAYADRSTSTPAATFKYVDTLGGTSFRSPNIDYPSTWYYFYGLEVESANLKSAKLVPKDNLINPDTSKWAQGSAGGRWELFADPNRVRLDKQIEVLPNTKYTIKVNGNYDVYVRQFAYEGGFEIGTSQWNVDGATLTTTATTRLVGIILRKKDNSAITISDVQTAKPMFAQGDWDKNVPYEEIMKPAKLISNGSLTPPTRSGDWVLRAGTTYMRHEGRRTYWDSNQDYAGIQVVLSSVGLPESMFQGKDIVFGGQVHPSATVMFYYRRVDGTPIYTGVSKVTDNGARAMTVPAGSTEHRIYVQSDTGGRGELWCEDVFLKFGSDKEYKPYSPALKPAILYPKKNLFNGITEKGSFDSVGVIGDPNVNVRGLQFIPVVVGKAYTFSVKDKSGVFPRFYWYDENKAFISSALGNMQTAPARSAFLRWHTGSITVDDLIQIEEGSVATEYKPYELGIKPL